jgi:hypothetical protein
MFTSRRCASLVLSAACFVVSAAAQAGTVTFADGDQQDPYSGNNVIAGASFVFSIGGFSLTADASGETLTQVKVRLDGARSGSMNFSLYADTNGNGTYEYGFDSGLAGSADPGDGNEATYNVSYSIPANAKRYFFIAGSSSPGSSGTIRGFINDATKITFSDGSTLSPAPNNSPLSTNSPSVPVHLSSIQVE